MSNPDVPSAGEAPLVGRRTALDTFARIVRATTDGEFRFLAVVGEPGSGKTRLLAELAALSRAEGLPPVSGRAAQFEQIMPFSALIDALDDSVDTRCADIAGRLDGANLRQLAAVFPALAGAAPDEDAAGQSDLARARVYRALRQLITELAEPDGLALILDDAHWMDDGSIEFLDYLLRHPPRGRVLVTVAYRPAQVSSRVAALARRGHQVGVEPLTLAEAGEFLGPSVNRRRRRALYQASGGNPFYLEALARMDRLPVGELPVTVLAALQVELDELAPRSLRIARAAAVTADEFEPALVAVTAEVPEPETLAALDELVARDIVRPAEPGRFRFRHPLVRQAAYESAKPGWRHGAHARLAARLAELGAPATTRAYHVERSGSFGDRHAVATLVTAARAVAARAPATCAHWLGKALDLTPVEPWTLEQRLELLMELSHAQAVSGRLAQGRDSARELLRLLPAGDHTRRGRAARICALMERQLDRPREARALLLDELGRMPDQRAAAAIPLRMRLVAESLMRMDFRAAQAVLDLMPDSAEGWQPGLALAVAALRPMPAYAAGRMADALRLADAAARLVTATPDAHLAEWLDAVAWLCWAELNLGRYAVALRHFERAAGIARATGHNYVLTNLLAGTARTLIALGRLPEALETIEESVEEARLLNSGQQLVFALTQLCLAAAWSGDHEAALRAREEAVATGVGGGEVWGSMARSAFGVALIAADRPEEGIEELRQACGAFDKPELDRATLLATCELLAYAEAGRGHGAEAALWADRAAELDHPDLPVFAGLIPLARAHALRATDPAAAATLADEAADRLVDAGRQLDAGRALLTAGLALGEAGRLERDEARARLRVATDLFHACGARALEERTVRARRGLGDRGAALGGADKYGLTPRELETALLVAEALTNQQIARRLRLRVSTVETHLSRVFDKVGVRSRVELATKLTRDA